MYLFRLLVCLFGVALYFMLRGTGPEQTKAGKPAPPPAARSINGDPSGHAGALQLTSHVDILPASNALAAGKPGELPAPTSSR